MSTQTITHKNTLPKPKNLVVHKFALQPGLTDLNIGNACTPLSVQLQNGKPVLWMEMDRDRPKEVFEKKGIKHVATKALCLATGQDMPEECASNYHQYAGTFQLERKYGDETKYLVYHVYVYSLWAGAEPEAEDKDDADN